MYVLLTILISVLVCEAVIRVSLSSTREETCFGDSTNPEMIEGAWDSLREEEMPEELSCSISGIREVKTSSQELYRALKAIIAADGLNNITCHGKDPEDKISLIKGPPHKKRVGIVRCERRRDAKQMGRETMAGIAMTVLPALAVFALAPVVFAEDPHLRNRPGKGHNYIDGMTQEDATCKPVTYAGACSSFDVLLEKGKFPLFQSYAHHRTLLEAVHDTIIAKADPPSCDLQSAHGNPCMKEKLVMKTHCPNDYQSAHYLNNDGKVASVKCPPKYELTEDCNFCRQMTGASLKKGSYPLQDLFCQSSEDDGSKLKTKMKGVCEVGVQALKKCDGQLSTAHEVVPFAVFKNSKKVYLDKLDLKTEENLLPDSFVCFEHKGQYKGTMDSGQTKRELKSFDISQCPKIGGHGSKKCTGDAAFCSAYECTAQYANAYCSHANGSGIVQIQVSGVWKKPLCVGYERVVVKRELSAKPIQRVEPCTTCITKCEPHGLVVRSTGFKISSAVACASGVCVTGSQSPSTEITLKYPGISQSSGGDIGVHMAHDDQSVSSKIVAHCPPQDPCLVHGCIVCAHGLINYQCHTALSAFVVVFVFSSIAITCLAILYRVLKCLKIAPRKVLNPLMWITAFIRWVYKKMVARVADNINQVNREIGWMEGGQLVLGNPAPIPRHAPIPRYSTYLMLLLIVSYASACSELIQASSRITTCSTEGVNTKCRLSGTALIRAGSVGAEACLMLKGVKEDQTKFLKIKTVSSELSCREGQSYWTGSFSPKCLSSRRCHLVGECHVNRCLSWRDNETSAEFSFVGESTTMRENKCFEQCGGWGCGCFNVNPSCLFVHTYLQSVRKEALRVFNCIDWVHKLSLEITDFDGSVSTIDLGASSSRFTNWGSVSLSLDAEGISGSNSFSFIESPGKGYAIVDEPFSEIPRQGFLGEIRCNSESSVLSAHESCLRAPNLISYKPMIDQLECTTNLIDPFVVFERGSLPQTRNEKTFAASKGNRGVQAFSKGSVQADLTLMFDNFEVDFVGAAVSCDAAFLNLTGCYSCNAGARVCLSITSTGTGTLSAHNKDGSLHIVLPSENGTKDQCQILHFTVPEVEEEFMYSCDGDERPLLVKGTLIAIDPFDDRREAGGESTVVNPKSGSWNFFDWFSGLMSWFGGPLKTILLICLYVALSIGLFFLLIYLGRTGLSKMWLAATKKAS
uniref:Envelopment polyprotein n=1 Tax=Rift valley fever virus TaxID=11588 RepID=A0A807NLE9_RVFV|nr:glycoprotein [Rift Valley fever virus]